MIKIICHTNLDDYERYCWPTSMACRPEKGDKVLSLCGNKMLKIVGITHAYSNAYADDRCNYPYLKVELNK